AQSEGELQCVALRCGQDVDRVEHRPAQLMQPRTRKVDLTPVARATRKSEASRISRSSSADFPTPGAPCTNRVPLPPPRPVSSTCWSVASSRSRPTSSGAPRRAGGPAETPRLPDDVRGLIRSSCRESLKRETKPSKLNCAAPGEAPGAI